MLSCFTKENGSNSTNIDVVSVNNYDNWLKSQEQTIANWLNTTGFKPKAGAFSIVPDQQGEAAKVVYVSDEDPNYTSFGALSSSLPDGVYDIQSDLEPEKVQKFAIAWGLGAYMFTAYKKKNGSTPQLYLPDDINVDEVSNICESSYLVRDLINTPTDDMGPADLANAAEKVAKEYGAEFRQIVGDELLKENYPSIHTVGRAGSQEPRLIDLRWGDPSHPKITLVGKGICFDTGGLDLKPSAGMRLMKKDMSGGAHSLGLAKMIMEAKLPIRLRVLIPAAENNVSHNAYRPGDIITTRKGVTVEVTNTDAEGRLVLCDALYEAAQEKPELIIDIATLTGAAKVALGTDVAALFSNRDELADNILRASKSEQDPMWRLPIYAPYRSALESSVADMVNASLTPFSAGATVAALFLEEFVGDTPWVHFDIMGWNLKAKPGKPEGGDAVCIRTLLRYLQNAYC